MTVAHECVYRQQLDGGDAETLQIFNVLGMAECAESTAIMRWKTVASPGQSLQMRFVDHRLAARMMRRPIADPVEVIVDRSEEHTSELQSLMRSSYAVFCLQKKNTQIKHT